MVSLPASGSLACESLRYLWLESRPGREVGAGSGSHRDLGATLVLDFGWGKGLSRWGSRNKRRRFGRTDVGMAVGGRGGSDFALEARVGWRSDDPRPANQGGRVDSAAAAVRTFPAYPRRGPFFAAALGAGVVSATWQAGTCRLKSWLNAPRGRRRRRRTGFTRRGRIEGDREAAADRAHPNPRSEADTGRGGEHRVPRTSEFGRVAAVSDWREDETDPVLSVAPVRSPVSGNRR